MEKFDVQGFAVEVEQAMVGAPCRPKVVRSLLEGAVDRFGPDAIIAALDAAIPPGADIGEMIVHLSPGLTVLYARVPPRFVGGVHDHTVFACIAPLRGREVNRTFEARADGPGLRQLDETLVGPGQVVTLPADAVHHIENPDRETASSLHFYGGDFRALMGDRSLWTGPKQERSAFSFEGLLRESVEEMRRRRNRHGLEALARAIPASAGFVAEALVSFDGEEARAAL